MTDSGGVQKEAFFFEKPCIILRLGTEWVEIVDTKAGYIADTDFDKIVDTYKKLPMKNIAFPQLFGNGKASKFILNKVISYLSYIDCT